MTAIDFRELMLQERLKLSAQDDGRGNAQAEKECRQTAQQTRDEALQQAALAKLNGLRSRGAALADPQLPLAPLPAACREHRVHEAGVYLLEQFLDPMAADELVAALAAAGPWIRLRTRNLLMLGGLPHSEGMLAEPLPAFLDPLADRLAETTGLGVNHVLVNDYDPGAGIAAHHDGPLYYERVAIVSLLSACEMRFQRHPEGQPDFCVTVPPRSLLVFEGDAYTKYQHGIEETDRTSGLRRISLTCRIARHTFREQKANRF